MRPSLRGDIGPESDHMVLVDGNNITMRSLFGMSAAGLVGPDGTPSGGVFGVLNTFRSLAADLRPTHMVWMFDQGKSKRRVAIYPDYKAHRLASRQRLPGGLDVTQAKDGTLASVKEFFLLFGVPYIAIEGVEADDLIAEAVIRMEGKMAITIVSSDHDMLQLCSEDGLVQVLRPHSRELFDSDAVVAKYGLTPRQLPEAWAIQGDPGDNIRGVPKLGEKRAAKIIQDHGGLKAALESDERVREYRDLVERNYDLISLLSIPEEHLPEGLEQCYLPEWPVDVAGLGHYLDQWGFESLRDLLPRRQA